METKTIYLAKDGKRFDDESDCLKYDTLIEKVETVLNTLKPIPNTSSFANGDGYVQQDVWAKKVAYSPALVRGLDISGGTEGPITDQ